MKKFKITVDGNTYEVEVEELNGGIAPLVSKPAPKPVLRETSSTTPKPVPKSASKPAAPKPALKPKASATPAGGEEVNAPMPGKILQLKVKEGDSVSEGDTLLILEAMKMENEIVANASGSVKKINVAVNDMVDTGDVLLVIG